MIKSILQPFESFLTF